MRSPEGVDEEGEPASLQRFCRLLPEIFSDGKVEHRRGWCEAGRVRRDGARRAGYARYEANEIDERDR